MIFDGDGRRARVQNKYLQSQRDEYIYSESVAASRNKAHLCNKLSRHVRV